MSTTLAEGLTLTNYCETSTGFMCWVQREVERLESLSGLKYALYATGIAYLGKFLLSVIFTLVLLPVISAAYPDAVSYLSQLVLSSSQPIVTIDLYTLLTGPLLETLIFQVILSEIMLKLTNRLWTAVLVPAVVFNVLHLDLIAIISLLPLSIILSLTYILKRKGSKFDAYLMTAGVHFLHNLIAVILAVLIVRTFGIIT